MIIWYKYAVHISMRFGDEESSNKSWMLWWRWLILFLLICRVYKVYIAFRLQASTCMGSIVSFSKLFTGKVKVHYEAYFNCGNQNKHWFAGLQMLLSCLWQDLSILSLLWGTGMNLITCNFCFSIITNPAVCLQIYSLKSPWKRMCNS